jgi:hypothetical protein
MCITIAFNQHSSRFGGGGMKRGAKLDKVNNWVNGHLSFSKSYILSFTFTFFFSMFYSQVPRLLKVLV